MKAACTEAWGVSDGGQTVVALMDAARADAQGELFPELSLATLTDAPPETP